MKKGLFILLFFVAVSFSASAQFTDLKPQAEWGFSEWWTWLWHDGSGTFVKIGDRWYFYANTSSVSRPKQD